MTPADLRIWRMARGLSQPTAARILGINPRTLAGLESGRTGSALFGPLARLIPLLDTVDCKTGEAASVKPPPESRLTPWKDGSGGRI